MLVGVLFSLMEDSEVIFVQQSLMTKHILISGEEVMIAVYKVMNRLAKLDLSQLFSGHGIANGIEVGGGEGLDDHWFVLRLVYEWSKHPFAIRYKNFFLLF